MRKAVAARPSSARASRIAKEAVPVRPAVARPVAAATAVRRPVVTRISSKPAGAPVRLAIVAPATPPTVAAESSKPENPFLFALLTKRRELTGNLEDTKFDTLAKMGRVAEDDQAQISHEEFISLQRNSMDYQAFRLVNAAIDRLNSGEYGTCAACEEPISEKRLKAIPWAKYCVTCQDRVQANGGSHPDSEDESESGESW